MGGVRLAEHRRWMLRHHASIRKWLKAVKVTARTAVEIRRHRNDGLDADGYAATFLNIEGARTNIAVQILPDSSTDYVPH